MGVFSRKIGVDLGSSRTRIIVPKKGIVLDEPSVVARDDETGKIVAVGNKALEMVGKTPQAIKTEYPLQRGVVADFGATTQMLQHFIRSTSPRFVLTKAEAMISVSMTATSTEQRAVLDVAHNAGIKDAHLIQSPIAAGLGAKLPLTEASGNLIIVMGMGTTEIAVISLGGVVSRRAIRVGGRSIDEAIILGLRRNYGLTIGLHAAEELKLSIGSLQDEQQILKKTAHGRSVMEGLPKSQALHASDLTPFITPIFEEVVRAVRSVIEQTQPELVGDIKKNGILLFGGTAKLRGIEAYLTNRLNTACHLGDKPSHAVVRGTGIALMHLEQYQRSLLKI